MSAADRSRQSTRRRHIRYAIEPQSGLVWSQVPEEGMAVPVLEYDKIGEGGDFTKPFTYHLEKLTGLCAIGALCEAPGLIWTKKIPIGIKNRHRKLWNMKELKAVESSTG